MKTTFSLIVGIVLTLSLTSCFVYHMMQPPQPMSNEQVIREVRNSWIGQPERDLFTHHHWGIPNRTAPDGQGGRMLEYSRPRSAFINGQYFRVNWITTFLVNSDGIVYEVLVRRE